jgi:hypothetical protein
MDFDRWLNAVRDRKQGGQTTRGHVEGLGISPYKPLLIAAVLARINQAKIATSEIVLDNALTALYSNMRRLLFPDWPHEDDPRQPFVRLAPEVWEMQAHSEHKTELAAILGAGASASWKAAMKRTECARLPESVFLTLRDNAAARDRLARIVLEQLQSSGEASMNPPDIKGLAILARLICSDDPAEAFLKESHGIDYMLEKAIEERVVADWSTTPFSDAGVVLHTNAKGELLGRQYPAGSWAIDLLGWQEAKNCWWVIEIKRGSGSDKAVGQVARYMGWIERNPIQGRSLVRGIVLARTIGRGLDHACHALPNIEPWTFDENLCIHAA